MARKKLKFNEIVPGFVNIIQGESAKLPPEVISKDGIFFVQRIKGKNVFGRTIYDIENNIGKALTESEDDSRRFAYHDDHYFTPLNDAEKRLVTLSLKKGWEDTSIKINEIIKNL